MRNTLTKLIVSFSLLLAPALHAQQETTEKASPLDGKTIHVLGDSYVKNHQRPSSEAWHALVAGKHHMTYRNFGRNGACVAFDRSREGFGPSLLVRYKDMPDDADLVVLIAGHNDAQTVRNSADTLQMFRDSLDLLLTGLQEKYPQAAIAYITPWYVDRDGFRPTVRAIRQICRKHRIPVLCNYKKSCPVKVRDADFRKKYFQGTNDTAHLNREGHELFLPVGEKFLQKVMKRHRKANRQHP